jgi:hypothetical protein
MREFVETALVAAALSGALAVLLGLGIARLATNPPDIRQFLRRLSAAGSAHTIAQPIVWVLGVGPTSAILTETGAAGTRAYERIHRSGPAVSRVGDRHASTGTQALVVKKAI